jgi:hypothetical protein
MIRHTTSMSHALLVGAVLLIAPVGMAQARHRAPREFSFVLEDFNGFRVDTRGGTVTKDMVADRDTMIALRLSEGELAHLHDTFRQLRLLAVPEPCPPYPPSPEGKIRIILTKPSTSFTFDLMMDGAHRRWSWGTEREASQTTTEWTALHAAADSVSALIRRRPEYMSLPPASGGYL